MGQGSINMPAPGRSPIEGILQALQAVHAYYGIDTQKQQQALLASQIKEQEPKTIEAEARASELKDFISGKGPGRFMLKDAGYIDDPNARPQVQAPTALPVRDTMASNDSVASDASGSSPLAGHIQKISDFSQPQQGTATQTPGARTVSLPGGGNTTMIQGPALREQQVKYQNDVLTGQEKQLQIQKLGQEMGLAAQESRRKGTSELEGLKSKFDEISKEPRNTLTAAKNISDSLLSGNPISEQMAQTQLPMLQLGVKRLSGSLISEAESKDTITAIKNLISQKSTGHLTPKELSLINNAAGLVEKSAAQELDKLGSDSADSAVAIGIPKDANFLKNRVFLPGGIKAQVPQTAVRIHPQTGKASLFKQSAPGKWQLVQQEE